MKTFHQLGEIVKVKIQGFEETHSQREVPVMILSYRNEIGTCHYFGQVLNEVDCFVDAVHVDGDGVIATALCLQVDLNRFRCMEDIAKYMGFSL